MQSRDSVPVQSDLLSAINQLGGSDVHIQAGADFHIAHLLNSRAGFQVIWMYC